MNELITTHSLDFEVADSKYPQYPIPHKMFRIGTCEGQWGNTDDSFYILSIMNLTSGNGHLDDVFEWFEMSCKKYCKNLLVLSCLNERFYDHLLNKRGFTPLDDKNTNCIKIFNKNSYKKLLRKGNEIIMKGSLECI